MLALYSKGRNEKTLVKVIGPRIQSRARTPVRRRTERSEVNTKSPGLGPQRTCGSDKVFLAPIKGYAYKQVHGRRMWVMVGTCLKRL